MLRLRALSTSRGQIMAAGVEAAALGDSYIANSINVGSTTWLDSRGWMHWANALLGAPLRIRPGAIQGVPGETTAQILARVGNITALSPRPRFCFVNGGVNDVGFGVSLDTMVSNMAAIIAALNAAGIIAVVGPIFAGDAADAGQISKGRAFNLAVSKMAAPASMIWCDWSSLILPTGYCVSGTLFDGIHPGSVGARGMASAVAAALGSRISGAHPLAATGALGNLQNPLMTGTGGTLANGFTGTGPSNWTFYRNATPTGGTQTCAKVTRTDGFGDWAEIALAGLVSAGKFQAGLLSANASYATLGLVEGTTMEAAAEVEIDAGAVNLDGPFLQVVDSDGTTQLIYQSGYSGPTGAAWGGGSWSGIQRMVIKSPPFLMRPAAGSPSFRVRVLMNGDGSVGAGITATMRVGRVTVRAI